MYDKWFRDEVADEFYSSGLSGRAFAKAYGMRRPALRSRVARDPRSEGQANKASRPEYDGGYRPRAVVPGDGTQGRPAKDGGVGNSVEIPGTIR